MRDECKQMLRQGLDAQERDEGSARGNGTKARALAASSPDGGTGAGALAR